VLFDNGIRCKFLYHLVVEPLLPSTWWKLFTLALSFFDSPCPVNTERLGKLGEILFGITFP
jgi:hypothetical protein